MKKTFLLSCLMLAAMPVMAAYTGRVYVDKNKNGVFDPCLLYTSPSPRD